jgi:hypothetical protein
MNIDKLGKEALISRKGPKVRIELIGDHSTFFKQLPFYTKAISNFNREQGKDFPGSSFPMNLDDNKGKNLQDMNLSPEKQQAVEEYLMNVKIYQPYLISEDMITHYRVESNINVNVKLEKFSLNDILEA